MLVFDRKTNSLHAPELTSPLSKTINRITIDREGARESAVLWSNGVDVLRIQLQKEALGELIGKVPSVVRLAK